MNRLVARLVPASMILAACAVMTLVLLGGGPACTRPDTGGAENAALQTPAETPSAAPETAAPPPDGEATPASEESPASPAPEETPAADEPGSTPGDEQSPPTGEEKEPMSAQSGPYRGLTPFSGVKAPEITEVKTIRFQTDAGDLLIEVYPQAAPNAAKQFVELVEAGFYDDTPIFRIVPGFVAQFGINWRGDMPKWKNKNFNDDPSLFRLEAGTLAFAKAGPNTNSTQVFINYADNSPLREQGGFTTFGKIIEGFDFTKEFVRAGDPSMGLDQQQLWTNGGKYLEGLPATQKPTMIKKAEVVETEN